MDKPIVPKGKPTKIREVKFFYGTHDYDLGVRDREHMRWRWWQMGWGGDMFDIIDTPELDKRIAAAKVLNTTVVDHLPAFCRGCEHCDGDGFAKEAE